jgi:hypothetical protein
MITPPLPRSIHNLTPLESGGVIARAGLLFQDHVAVSFCLEMVSSAQLTQVWCETQDDITLIWEQENHEEAEFVQVKDVHLGQLWSVAKLCEGNKEGASDEKCTSIFQKSLAHDRCNEPCRFRIVTSLDINDSLRPLSYPRTSPLRTSDDTRFLKLCAEVGRYVGHLKSPNGHDHTFWLMNAVWQVRHSSAAVENENLVTLCSYLEQCGRSVAMDQLRENIYLRLLAIVQAAACAKWEMEPGKKKILRSNMMQRVDQLVEELRYPASATGGDEMRRRMAEAGLSQETVATADVERILYRQQSLDAPYLDASERDTVEAEVMAVLQELRSQLDLGLVPDDGVAFHQLCLIRLAKLRDELRIQLPGKPLLLLSFLQGCMYSITDRKLHRFRRVTAS